MLTLETVFAKGLRKFDIDMSAKPVTIPLMSHFKLIS